MTTEFILQLIQNVGFPIAVCLFLMWFCKDSMSKLTVTVEHLLDVVETNTVALDKMGDTCDALKSTIYSLPCTRGGDCTNGSKNE